jgi:hypothetical protein
MSNSGDGLGQLGDPAFLAERKHVRQELEHGPTSTDRLGITVRPVDTGTLTLTTLPTSPFWARRYTRRFLDSCQEISPDIAETAELIVSELVTNAVRYAGEPAGITQHPQRTAVSLIGLSLRNFREVLLIEVTIPTATRRFCPVLMIVRKMAEG